VVRSDEAAKDLETIEKTAGWAMEPLLASMKTLRSECKRDLSLAQARRAFENTLSQVRATQRAVEVIGEQLETLWTVYYEGQADE
jgi:hypothetical protein